MCNQRTLINWFSHNYKIMKLSCTLLSISVLFQCATAWTSFDSLGGGVIHVASSSWGPGRMNIFGIANNGQVYHRSFRSGIWSDWESLGGYTQLKPAAFSIKPNWVDIVYTGPDQMLYRKTWNGLAWNDWRQITNEGKFIYGPTLTASPVDTTNLHVFGVSKNRALYHCVIDVTNDQSSLWEDLGGELVGEPAAVSYGSNRFDVFGVAYDNRIWQKTYDYGWREWKVLYGGQYKPGIGVASKGPGSINVFGRGLDDTIYYRSYGNGKWHDTERMRGQVRGSMSAVATGSTRVDVFVAGESDGAVYHSYLDSKSDNDPTDYGCYRGFCWTNCSTVVADEVKRSEWCYTTKGFNRDFKYVSCEGFDSCQNNWKCAGSCMV
ncbi:uncharacterized protein LOC119080476 [Bradysia coprophila]|uniref:uncharacterized protein LOC119080476 n=1 Tax=Bradysia coprophila TaxID=38358 RepID=UPI00187D91D5|nr:uncharacterized protein LOC119080476 [Bradysia coprophila]